MPVYAYAGIKVGLLTVYVGLICVACLHLATVPVAVILYSYQFE